MLDDLGGGDVVDLRVAGDGLHPGADPHEGVVAALLLAVLHALSLGDGLEAPDEVRSLHDSLL